MPFNKQIITTDKKIHHCRLRVNVYQISISIAKVQLGKTMTL